MIKELETEVEIIEYVFNTALDTEGFTPDMAYIVAERVYARSVREHNLDLEQAIAEEIISVAYP